MLSVVLATYNEEKNIGECLASVKGLADEIVVVDGTSNDRTVEIAKQYGAKVIIVKNEPMFHINKQKALDVATGDWILQLDADEKVTAELASEIKKVIVMSEKEIEEYQQKLSEKALFLKHQRLIQTKSEILSSKSQINSKSKILNSKRLGFRDSNLFGACNLEFSAFYIARKNYFLGKFLRYGGVYPDGVIRLVKKGKARFPCRDVHELMEVDGQIGWLSSPLLHFDSPTFKRYLERNNRYVNLLSEEIHKSHNLKLKTFNLKNKSYKLRVTSYEFQTAIDWLFIKPLVWFLSTSIRHKGILDGWQGIVFSFFSALRFPRSYWRYIRQI